MPTNTLILFSTRIARLFAYGSVSVILVLYLAQVGLSEAQIGLLLTFTLIGDTAISLWLTTNADRIGRKKMLIVGAGLMIFAGILFGLTNNIVLLFIAATIGSSAQVEVKSVRFFRLSKPRSRKVFQTKSAPESLPGTTWLDFLRRRWDR